MAKRAASCATQAISLKATRRALGKARRASGTRRTRATLAAALKSAEEALRVVETEYAAIGKASAFRVPLLK